MKQSDDGPLIDKILHCDCVEGMARLPDECIHSVVTSPPYDQTFDYGGHGWGREIFEKAADQLARVLVTGGRIAWMVKDQYRGGSFSGTSCRQCLYFLDNLGLRFADEIYIKYNSIKPYSNRYGEQVQKVFVFSKGRPNRGRRLEDRVNKCAGAKQSFHRRYPDGTLFNWRSDTLIPHMGVRSNVWEYTLGKPPAELKGFPAAMLLPVARDLICSYARPGELILDPYSGSGTTAVAALLEFRHYLGFEIWDWAYDISVNRLAAAHREHQRMLDRVLGLGQRSDSER